MFLGRSSLGLPPVGRHRTLYCKIVVEEISLGELWLGLKELHRLTSGDDYGLQVILKDFDGDSYMAHYDQFKVTTTKDMK